MNENELSRIIYEAAIEAHRTLGGPGLLESVYEEAAKDANMLAPRAKLASIALFRITIELHDYFRRAK
jgi:hypothetical protein